MSNWQDIVRQSLDTKEALDLPSGPGGAAWEPNDLGLPPETAEQ